MPQTWRALWYDTDADRLAPRTLPATADAVVRRNAGRSGLSVFVVSSDEAPIAVRAVAGLEVRRQQTKDVRKGLAVYVPARATAVHVSAPYRDPGQAERGVRALALSRAGKRWPGVYLLEVDAKLFERLWARAGFAVSGDARDVPWPAGDALPSGPGSALDTDDGDVEIPKGLLEAFVGASSHAQEVRRRIVLASLTDHPVLVAGETGTGKEVVARQIHQLSRRRQRSFVTVNCAAIAYDLLESELFGHARGSFTGALSDKVGLYEVAQDGTLFLDEVADLQPTHQAKVLRILNDGDYRPIGAHQSRKGNARVIAATNRNLPQMVSAGTFRDDLYYRLLSFVIETPALRHHVSDIPTLAEYLWPGVIKNTACSASLSAAVLELLKDYPWHGNVRELRAFLANLSTLAARRALIPALVAKAFHAWTGSRRRRDV